MTLRSIYPMIKWYDKHLISADILGCPHGKLFSTYRFESFSLSLSFAHPRFRIKCVSGIVWFIGRYQVKHPPPFIIHFRRQFYRLSCCFHFIVFWLCGRETSTSITWIKRCGLHVFFFKNDNILTVCYAFNRSNGKIEWENLMEKFQVYVDRKWTSKATFIVSLALWHVTLHARALVTLLCSSVALIHGTSSCHRLKLAIEWSWRYDWI